MLKNVRVGKRLVNNGITENHKGFPKHGNIRVFGADTETCHGAIFTFQICSQGEEILQPVKPATAFVQFMEWVDPRIVDKGVNIIFFHNLRFDLTVLFSPNQETIYNQYNDIRFERDGYVIKMLYGRVNTVMVWKDYGGYVCPRCGDIPKEGIKRVGRALCCANPLHGEPVPVKRNLGTCVKWLDSAAFCPPGSKSMDAALRIYGVPAKKLPTPPGLGDRILDTPEFRRYALNDARLEEQLGLAILDLHKDYDVTPCVSLPQLSARILRHHFFFKGESFPFPPEECRKAAELSYHAGKNGFYSRPGCYLDLYEYDINSAFPKAMKEMPQMVQGSYKRVRTYRPGYLGIYRISGRWRQKPYTALFDAAFKPLHGKFRDVWTTGYELALLKPSGCRYRIHEGWIWRHYKKYNHSPLGQFVEKFWTLKNTAPKGPRRDTYKNILNSLYGKFAACVEKRPSVETALGPVTLSGRGHEAYYVSGALYHPFIATQITGYVRADLYRLETSGQALHAATDSIKSTVDLPTGEQLGDIKKECFGKCYLFRNKLYLHFAKDTRLCKHDLEKGWLGIFHDEKDSLPDVGERHDIGKAWDPVEQVWRGKLFDGSEHLCKFGLHGFKGSVFTLYRERDALLKRGYLDYSYRHMVNLREGTKRGETVCDMTTRQERLLLSAPS